MRIEQDPVKRQAAPFTLKELKKFRGALKLEFGDALDNKLVEFAKKFCLNPYSVPEENRDVALKIHWMMKLIPTEPNPN